MAGRGRIQKRDSRGRFASGSSSIVGLNQGAQRRKDRGSQTSRAAARARDNLDKANAGIKLAKTLSRSPGKKSPTIADYAAKMAKKASRSKRISERAKLYYKSTK